MITYGKQVIEQDDIDSVILALKSDFLTVGPLVEQFEQALCRTTGAKYAVVCNSCTSALHMACIVAGVKKNSLGITSPITFVASANAIEMCGGRVGLIDIDSSYCLDPEQLEDYCRKNIPPKVVIPVSFAGIPCQLPKLYDLSKKYDFILIEDAAHSLGSKYQFSNQSFNSASCAHSHMATLSFHPVKTITTGEGGAVLTNDQTIAEKLRLLRSHGIQRNKALTSNWDGDWYYEMQTLGYNYRITDLQCALGITQLNKLERFIDRRKKLVSKYNELFSGLNKIILPPCPNNTIPTYHIYPVCFTDGVETRSTIYKSLKERDIHCQVHYIPVHHHPYYKNSLGMIKVPESDKYYSGCLSLPLHCGLTDDEQHYVAIQLQMLLEKS